MSAHVCLCIYAFYIILMILMQVVAQTIKSCLNELPGFPRTQIGFATFDSTIHFYNMKVCNIIIVTDLSAFLSFSV